LRKNERHAYRVRMKVTELTAASDRIFPHRESCCHVRMATWAWLWIASFEPRIGGVQIQSCCCAALGIDPVVGAIQGVVLSSRRACEGQQAPEETHRKPLLRRLRVMAVVSSSRLNPAAGGPWLAIAQRTLRRRTERQGMEMHMTIVGQQPGPAAAVELQHRSWSRVKTSEA